MGDQNADPFDGDSVPGAIDQLLTNSLVNTSLTPSSDGSVVIDPSAYDPNAGVDMDAGNAGEWESSGILDVSELFGKEGGQLFLANVQAHGIKNQNNPGSLINDHQLVEGGQMIFLEEMVTA